MTNARNAIRLVIQDLDCVIEILEASNANATAEAEKKRTEKAHAMMSGSGMGYLRASEQFDHSIGFNTGIAVESKDSIELLKKVRNHCISVNKIFAEEAEQEEEE